MIVVQVKFCFTTVENVNSLPKSTFHNVFSSFEVPLLAVPSTIGSQLNSMLMGINYSGASVSYLC